MDTTIHQFWLQRGGVALALVPKAGLQSMQSALARAESVHVSDALNYDTRVAFIREPLTRLYSAYSFFYWMIRDGIDVGLECKHVETWESFVDLTFEQPNQHWAPQTQILTYNGTFLPNKVHPFENVQDYWEEYFGPGMLPHKNAVTRRPTTDYRLDELTERYAKDTELWRSL